MGASFLSSIAAPLGMFDESIEEFDLFFSSIIVTSLDDSPDDEDIVEVALADCEISNDSSKDRVEFCSESSSSDNDSWVEKSSKVEDSSGSIPDISAFPSEHTML